MSFDDLPHVDLEQATPQPEVLRRVPLSFCHRHGVVPLEFKNEVLVCAVAEDADIVSLVIQLSALCDREVQPVLASAEDIKQALAKIDLPA